MPIDIFLKLEGITGESNDAQHRDEIDALSWSWSMAIPAPAPGGAAGKVSFGALTIAKRVDAATPKLMLSCASAQHVRSALLTVRRRSATPFEYLKIRLDDVVVTSVAVGEPGHGGEATETVTLAFREVRLDYVGQSDTGAATPPVSFGWDLVRNVKL
jgi:type VI secretion system secreted protein Hcp